MGLKKNDLSPVSARNAEASREDLAISSAFLTSSDVGTIKIPDLTLKSFNRGKTSAAIESVTPPLKNQGAFPESANCRMLRLAYSECLKEK